MKLRKILLLIIPILILITLIPQNVFATTAVDLPARVNETYEWGSGIYSMEAEKNTWVTMKGVKNTTDTYNEDVYDNVAIEPSVGYAYYAAKTLGLNDSDLQSVISTSDSWNNTTNVKVRDSSQEIDGTGTLYKRSKQYGTVYYGILEDSIRNNKRVFRIKNEDSVKENIKVLADQEAGTYTVGPYKLELNVDSNEYTNEAAKILYSELNRTGNEGYTLQNAFAKTNNIGGMNTKEGTNPIFVDEKGKQIIFPDFIPGQEKNFYIRFIPANEGAIIETGNPTINTSYLTKFTAKKFIKGTPTTVKFGTTNINKTNKLASINFEDSSNLSSDKTEVIEQKESSLKKREYGEPAIVQLDDEILQKYKEHYGITSTIDTNAMRKVGATYENNSTLYVPDGFENTVYGIVQRLIPIPSEDWIYGAMSLDEITKYIKDVDYVEIEGLSVYIGEKSIIKAEGDRVVGKIRDERNAGKSTRKVIKTGRIYSPFAGNGEMRATSQDYSLTTISKESEQSVRKSNSIKLIDVYNSIQNPIENNEIIKKVLEEYSSSGRIGFYNGLVSINSNDDSHINHSDLNQLMIDTYNKYIDTVIQLDDSKIQYLESMGIDAGQLQQYFRTFGKISSKEDLDRFFNNPLMQTKSNDCILQSNVWWHVKSQYISAYMEDGIDVKHRLYIGCQNQDVAKLAQLFIKKCEDRKISYYFKFSPWDAQRDDKIVIYADTDNLANYIEALKEIAQENPEIIERCGEPPILTGKIDGWIGIGDEPLLQEDGSNTSFNELREEIITDSIKDAFEPRLLDLKDKIITYNGQRVKFIDVIADKISQKKIDDLVRDYSRLPEEKKEIYLSGKGLEESDFTSDLFKEQIKTRIKDSPLMERPFDLSYVDYITIPTRNGKNFEVTGLNISTGLAGVIPVMEEIDPSFVDSVKTSILDRANDKGIDNTFVFLQGTKERFEQEDARRVETEMQTTKANEQKTIGNENNQTNIDNLIQIAEKQQAEAHGGNSEAFFIEDYALLKGPIDPEELDAVIKKTKELEEKGVNVARTLDYKITGKDEIPSLGVEYPRGYVLQERAKGSPLLDETNWKLENGLLSDDSSKEYLKQLESLSRESQEVFNKYVRDYFDILESGLSIDPSKASNFIYEPGKGITFIDLGVSTRKEALAVRTLEAYTNLKNTKVYTRISSGIKGEADKKIAIINEKFKKAALENGIDSSVVDMIISGRPISEILQAESTLISDGINQSESHIGSLDKEVNSDSSKSSLVKQAQDSFSRTLDSSGNVKHVATTDFKRALELGADYDSVVSIMEISEVTDDYIYYKLKDTGEKVEISKAVLPEAQRDSIVTKAEGQVKEKNKLYGVENPELQRDLEERRQKQSSNSDNTEINTSFTERERQVFEKYRISDDPFDISEEGLREVFSGVDYRNNSKVKELVDTSIEYTSRILKEVARKRGLTVKRSDLMSIRELHDYSRQLLIESALERGYTGNVDVFFQAGLEGFDVGLFESYDSLIRYVEEQTRSMSASEIDNFRIRLSNEYQDLFKGITKYNSMVLDGIDEATGGMAKLSDSQLLDSIRYLDSSINIMQANINATIINNELEKIKEDRSLGEFYESREFITDLETVLSHNKNEHRYLFHGTQTVENAVSIGEQGLGMIREGLESTTVSELDLNGVIKYQRGMFRRNWKGCSCYSRSAYSCKWTARRDSP